MLQQPYISGFERKQFAAFGVQLHPLTLGHIQLLAMMGSAIPFPSAKIGLDDMGMLVFAASFARWEDAIELSSDASHLAGYQEKILSLTPHDIKAGCVSSADYLEYYMCRPINNSPRLTWDQARVPWWWGFAEFLQTEMGRSEGRAWATICSDAFAYWACYITRNGDESVCQQRDAIIEQRIRSGLTIAQQFDEGLL